MKVKMFGLQLEMLKQQNLTHLMLKKYLKILETNIKNFVDKVKLKLVSSLTYVQLNLVEELAMILLNTPHPKKYTIYQQQKLENKCVEKESYDRSFIKETHIKNNIVSYFRNINYSNSSLFFRCFFKSFIYAWSR
jgi:hypothetical protein